MPSVFAFERSHLQSPTSTTELILGFFAGILSSNQSVAQVQHLLPGMVGPGNAELQLGISPCRKTDASVAGEFTFRMAPFSLKRRRKGVGVVDAELEFGGPRGPRAGPIIALTLCRI
jgi:hypothetical protein